MKIGACILARIGSKRLPQKNIKPLLGKPLCCWSLDAALEADVFHDITVSTDSEKVAEIVCETYGNKVNVLIRPQELADDNCPPNRAFAHYLMNRPEIDVGSIFLPTYPFRSPQRIREIAHAFYSRYPWKAFSQVAAQVCSSDYFYPKFNEDGQIVGYRNTFDRYRAFYGNHVSSAYVFYDRNYFKAETSGHAPMAAGERKLYPFITHKENIDIDTQEDFQLAEAISTCNDFKFKPLREIVHKDWSLVAPADADFDGIIDYLGPMLDDTSYPIGIMDKMHYGGLSVDFSFRAGAFPYHDHDALDYITNEKSISTGNAQFNKTEYRQNQHFRILRNIARDENLYQVNTGHGDHHGLAVCVDYSEKRPDFSCMLPKQRVILTDDLKERGLYVSPYEIVKQTNGQDG